VLGALAVPAPTAQAHPFGPPPIAEVRGDGTEVVVTWTARDDDVTALAASLGALPRQQVFDVGEDGGVAQVAGDDLATSLREAPGLRDYVRDRIVVRQDGAACPRELEPVGDVVADGVTVTATCPRPADEVELQISMLHDLHPAYRTVSRVTGGSESLHTAEDPAATLSLRAGGPVGRGMPSAAVLAPVVGLAALLGGVGAAVVMSRPGRRPRA